MASVDPYHLLKLSRAADGKAIQAAYRRLAKECHPDLHPGDAKAEERFKALTQAYGILGDVEKRRLFDLGLMGPDGAARADGDTSPPRRGGGKARSAGGGMFREPFMDETFDDSSIGSIWENLSPDGVNKPVQGDDDGFTIFTHDTDSIGDTPLGDDDDLSDLFKEIFREPSSSGPIGGTAAAQSSLRGRDMRYSLNVSFAEAAYGGRKRLPLNSGRDVEVIIPPASENGQVIRLSGKGLRGAMGAVAGDALVELTVEPHAIFTRQGLDLSAMISLSLEQAVIGGRVTLEGLRGPISLMLPSPTQPGQKLTYRGFGLRAGEFQGDLQITVQLLLPDPVDADLLAFCRKRV
jgi:DnaJ-class molecular chaperone